MKGDPMRLGFGILGISENLSIAVRTAVRIACAVGLLAVSTPAVWAADGPHRVLVLHSFRTSLPVNADWQHGITRGFASAPELKIEIDIEAPDLSRFRDADYVGKLLDIYRRKYDSPQSKPDLIIPTYTPALRFLLEHGEDLFPGTPVVFLGADAEFIAARKLPAHFTGITGLRDITGTLALALHVHPDTRRVALIVGAGAADRVFEVDARRAVASFKGRFEAIWLEGLPLEELVDAVKKLPDQAVILYLVQLQDRNGKAYVPINMLRTLTTAADVPIYGLWDTLLGHGVVGGRLATLEEDAFRAAQMALRILKGEAPTVVPIVDRTQNSAIFDGMELARRKIAEDRLPAGSRVRHRPVSAWDAYRTEIIAAGLVIAVQALLILALLLNRARLKRAQAMLRSEATRRAEVEAMVLRSSARLARLGRERNLGAMATTIAHEIGQPLIAIQNYAQAANRRVQRDGDQAFKVAELIGKIEEQAARVGDIIKRIRSFVSADRAVLHPISLGAVIASTLRMIGPEMGSRGCRIAFSSGTDLPAVHADELQVQLVLVNLLQNAAQAMEKMDDRVERIVDLGARPTGETEVEISVADRGPGISADVAEDLFEPLSSGRADGMGIGLAMCQTIVEAHGGRIWHTPNPFGGASFRFTLRRAAA